MPVTPGAGASSATVIARGVKVEGEFHSQGDVLIEGDVQGTISAAGTLTVGPEAKIQANITAQEAIISGEVNGNLQIKNQAIFHASARVKGDIVAERITVESGASIDGRVQIGGGQAAAKKDLPVIQKEETPASETNS